MTLKPIDTPSVVTPTAHSSSGLVQPMFHTASATSDANGNITFTFGGVFTGQILIGSFSCPSAPYTAQFTAYNNSQEVYSWQSSNNPGPLRVAENQQITVVGTGLVANTTYVMNWVGYSTVSGFAPQVVPDSHTDVVISTNQGGLQIASITAPANQYNEILAAPPAGFAYRIHSITVGPGLSTSSGEILVGSQGGPYWFAYPVTANQYICSTSLMNGLLVDQPIWAFSVAQAGIDVSISINYDVIQI